MKILFISVEEKKDRFQLNIFLYYIFLDNVPNLKILFAVQKSYQTKEKLLIAHRVDVREGLLS